MSNYYMIRICKQISEAEWFNRFVTFAILIAGILVGIATYSGFAAKHAQVLDILNEVILYIFILEIAVKILAKGTQPQRYFADGWNVFDFIIVMAAFLPFGGSSVAILRLLRLLRVLKLIKALPKLQMLVGALLKSIPSMGYVSILLLLLFYIYAVAGVFLFGENDPLHFENLQVSMLTLFRVVTLEDWTDIMYINMYGCANYGYAGKVALCTSSETMPLVSPLFFVSFVLIGTMIMMNMFIGVIMTGMEEAKEDAVRAERLAEAANNPPNNQEINIDQLEQKLDEMQELLQKLKASPKQAELV